MNIFGTKPNQIPLNSYLGELAYLNKEALKNNEVFVETTIAASGTYSIPIPVNLDPKRITVDIKFLDTDSKYYSAMAVAYFAIDPATRNIVITNDYEDALTFFIVVRG